MKRALTGALLLLGALGAGGAVLVDDDWSAGVRNVQSLPERSAWYYTSTSRLVASPGAMTATVDSSRLAITYFTESEPYELADGETMKVTVEFTPMGVNTASMSRGMRIGLFNFGSSTRLSMDDFSSGDNGSTGVTGYLLNMNFSQTFNISNPLELRRRNGDLTGFTTNGNLMGSVPGSGLYGDVLGTGGEAASAGFVSGVRYTLEYSVTRTGDSISIQAKFSDGLGWSVQADAVTADNPVTGFDAFAMRPDSSANSVTSIEFHSFKVETTGDGGPIDPPPPATSVLLDDDWSSGVRNVQSLPDRSAWYYTSSTRLNVVDSELVAEVDQSRLAITYFTDSTPYSLNDGETLKVTLEFTPTGVVNTASTSKGLRIGMFNYGSTTRIFEDGFSSSDNGAAGVTGYLVNMNFSGTVNIENGMELRRRNGDDAAFAANGNLMGSVPGSGLYSDSFGVGGGALSSPGFVSGVRYTLEYSVERTGDTAMVTVRFTDGTDWSLEVAGESTAGALFDFDAFALRADGPANTASQFTFHRIRVEVLGGTGGGDFLDPDAFSAFIAESGDLGDGWFESGVLGVFQSPSDMDPYVYLPYAQAWFEVLGTTDGLYIFYNTADQTWWATRNSWSGVLWSYDYQDWYSFDGRVMTLVPDQEDPPVTASGLVGYAAVSGLGLATTTGGKGGAIVYVDSIAQLKAEAAGTTPKIIVVSGNFEGADSISVGSNKTIVGAHPGSYLRGIGFEINNQSNVIIRNFRISHVLAGVANDGDCIRVVNGSHHVWIDHCEFFNDNPREQTNKDLYDGLTDITNGSDFVTISWSHYHDHHKFILIGSTDTASRYNDDQHLRVTMHHNLLENPYKKDSRIGTRIPSLRFGKAHVFNSVFRNLGEGIRARHDTAKILVEENVFDYLGYAWTSDDGGCFTIGNNLMINEANKNAQTVPFCDPDFVPPYAYDAFIEPAEDVEASVLAGVGVGKIDPLANLP